MKLDHEGNISIHSHWFLGFVSNLVLHAICMDIPRQHEKWEADIIEGIAGLLKATDPEINSEINKATFTGYVLTVQLLLNAKDPNQERVNQLMNQLAFTANGWKPEESPSALLEIFTLNCLRQQSR